MTEERDPLEWIIKEKYHHDMRSCWFWGFGIGVSLATLILLFVGVLAGSSCPQP